MGTKVQCKSYLPGYNNSMRDLNEDSNCSSWPHFYGDKSSLTNTQYYNNNFMPRTVTDSYPGYDKDVLKQKMLEHETIFKNQDLDFLTFCVVFTQVYELHRLYRIQRDMMEEFKKKDRSKHQISTEPSSSSSRLPSHIPNEDARKWHIPSFPLSNPGCSRPSILGADIINSPLSCTNGNSLQAGRVPLQNGSVSKDCEVLDSRPSKVRKKLFDLQLPAEEYIDTEEGEQIQDNNVNHRITTEKNTKLFLAGKIDCPGDTSESDSHLRSSVRLADLNEPIQIETGTTAPSVDFLCRSIAKTKSQFLGLPQEFVNGSDNRSLNNLSVESKGNGREWLPYMHEAESSKRNPNPFSQCLQPEKKHISSHPIRLMPNKAHQPLGIFPTDHSRGDMWSEKKGLGLEISDRIQERCNYNNLDRISSSYPFVNSSELANSWSHSVSSWGNPSSSLTQKLTSVQRHPSFNSPLSRNSQPSDQTQEILGDNWHVSGSFRSNPGLASELPIRNGFYQGSSSGSKELSAGFPSVGFDYMNRNKGDHSALEHVIGRGSEKFLRGSNFMDLKRIKDMNLNAFPLDSSNEAVSKDPGLIGEKGDCQQDRLAVLPWLRAKPARKNELVGTNFMDLNSSNQLCIKESVKLPNHIFTRDVTSASNGTEVGVKKEIGDCKRILGFPIFGNPDTSGNNSPFLEDTKIKGKRNVIDINVAYDAMFPDSDKQISTEALVVDKGTDSKPTNYRKLIDLNLCMSDDEGPSTPFDAITGANLKIAVEIDLEAAPVDLESEEEHKQHEVPAGSPQEEAEQQEDELIRNAAKAIVFISSAQHHKEDTVLDPSEASVADLLLFFFEAVSCSPNIDLVKESSSVEIDYFEAMTLQLPETKEEDYMPKYMVPVIQETQETGVSSIANRTRRGQARRGRQRRDFQRDILPGLISLSRHEITEDLQTFGGLMRATGHTWLTGLSRRSGGRNGAGRGRRRVVVDPAPSPAPPVVESPVCAPLVNSIEVELKDTNLTGWGKTTRRPRRQRCPPGNPVAVALT
ncbi:hypothetical protein LguiA_000411 [Lonicera macranthoides]